MMKPGKMLGAVLQSTWRKPATILYPFTKIKMPPRFRGKLKFHPARCIGCKMCVRDCPSGAIDIVKVGDKQFEAHIDLSRCVYCAQCVDSCPKAALEATGDFELAGLDRNQLKVVFHAEPKEASPAQVESGGQEPGDADTPKA